MDDRGNFKEVQFLPCNSLHKQTPNPGSQDLILTRLCPSAKDLSCSCSGGCPASCVAHADGQSCFKETEEGKQSHAIKVIQTARMPGTHSDAGFLGLPDKQRLLSSAWAQTQLQLSGQRQTPTQGSWAPQLGVLHGFGQVEANWPSFSPISFSPVSLPNPWAIQPVQLAPSLQGVRAEEQALPAEI